VTSVPPLILVLVLGAALLHATWNAMLRSGADRLWSIAVMCGIGALAAVPLTFLVPAPNAASWPYIALSTALQIGYCLFLVRAYRDGLLSQVYPIARGAAPLLVALAAAVFASEHLSGKAIAGLALVSAGIMGLSLGRDRPDARSTAAALVCGALIAAYMVTDGVGVRLAGQPTAYVVWMSIAQGAPMPFVYLIVRRRFPAVRLNRELAKSVGGGLISLIAYGIVVWAMSSTDMAKVSGLRETSILFAAVLGAVFLKERLSPMRGACAVIITTGAILLAS
jgi:drug/metabolite transporter (DMT)-like permease